MTSRATQIAAPVWTTLPSRYYWSEDIFQLEKERIFYDTWLYVGRVQDIPSPGDFMTQDIVDESVIVVRNRQGSISAFFNVCRHRGNKLCGAASGKFRGSAIPCGYHGWTYDLEGKLIATPNMIGTDEFRKEDFPLYPVALHVWKGCIFVNLSADPKPFDPDIGPVADKIDRYNLENLAVGARREYFLQANWKIVNENNIECYHCPSIHPELCAIQPNIRNGMIGSSSSDGNLLIEGGNAFTPDATTKRPLISTIRPEDEGRFRSTPIWPCFFLGLLPDSVFAFNVWPIAPEKSKVTVEWLFEPSTIALKDFDPSDTVDFGDNVLKQDFGICQSVQKGVKARAHKAGVYAANEFLLREFNEWIRARIDG